MIVARRLDDIQSGSGQYLLAYLALCRAQSLHMTLVFAPQRSFGNLAWSRVHPEILAVVDDIDWSGTMRVAGRYVSTSPKVWARFTHRLGCEAIRAVRRQRTTAYPSKLGQVLGQAETTGTVKRAKQCKPDFVTVEYSSLAPLLAAFPEQRRLVLLHDLFSLRAQNFMSQGLVPDHVDLSLHDEARRCDAAQIVIHASHTEIDALQGALPKAEHIWMRPKVPTFTTQEKRRDDVCAVFIGSKHAGNDGALTYLRTSVWPLVRQRVPLAKLHIVGTIGDTIEPEIAAREGLVLIGAVPDLARAVSCNAVGIAPMDLGSGIPIKIIDYLALGLAVVATGKAIRPFGRELDDIVATAETPEEFAEKVAQLLQNDDLRKAASRAGQAALDRLSNTDLSSILAG